MTAKTSPLRLRVQWPSGPRPGWAVSWMQGLSASDGLLVLDEPAFGASPGAAPSPAAGPDCDIELWPGAVGARPSAAGACEWIIVDPHGTPVLDAARSLRAAARGQGWELLLLEREGPTRPWLLRRRAHVACPSSDEPALRALAIAAARLVRQGAIDRSLGLPALPVPLSFVASIGRPAKPPAPVPALRRGWAAARDWWLRQRSRWVSETWCIGVIDAPIHEVLASERLEVRWITQPQDDGYFADPFGLPGDDRRLCCEYFDERTGKGRLETLTLDDDGSVRFRESIDVGQGGHASFPTAFELDGRRYGMAEMVEERRVTLHTIDERGRWEPVADLLCGVEAADPVLFKWGDWYWLAYTDVRLGNMDNLCLQYAERPEGPWRPHANNPVKVDIRGARMAGLPFVHEGRLYRPSQDCLQTYGQAVVIHRIDHLSPQRFEETVIRRLAADPAAHLPHGMHTLSAWGGRTLVDAKIERMNLVSLTRKFRDRIGRPAKESPWVGSLDDRVFIYIPHLRTGGGEISMLRVAEGLAERGLDVEVVVHESQTRELTMPRGVTLIDLQAKGTAQAVRRLAQRIRKRSPRWVISAFPHTNVATVTAVKMARNGALSVLTEHAPLSRQIDQQNNWRYRALPMLVRAAYRRADAVVAVSAGVKEDLRPLVGRRVRIHTINNPVLPDDFETAAEAVPAHPWLQDAGVQVVMSMCRLSEEKDLATLIRAFARLRAAHPVARLLLVGEGPDRGRLQRLIDEAGLADVAQLPGRTDQPLAWMRSAAVFVLSSTFEGFGNVLVEAMAVGTPVVSTDCPVGPREILADGRYGDLVPVGDDAAMARAISRALTVRRQPEGAREAAMLRTQSRSCDEYLALLNHIDLLRSDEPC